MGTNDILNLSGCQAAFIIILSDLLRPLFLQIGVIIQKKKVFQGSRVLMFQVSAFAEFSSLPNSYLVPFDLFPVASLFQLSVPA